jgi:O-antigen/teichoic acid export membrane protein
MRSFWQVIMPVFGLMGARLAGAGFGFVSQIVLARAFVPHDVGVAFLAISVTSFISLLITCGYHTIALTYLARFQAFGRSQLVWAFLYAARRDMAVVAVVLAALSLLAMWLLPDHDTAKAFLYGTLAALPLAAIRLNNSAANAQKRFTLSYAPDFVVRPALLLAFIGAMVLLGVQRNIDYVLVAMVVIALAVAVGQAVMLGADNAFVRGRAKPSRDLRRFYRRRAAAMLMFTIVAGATADLVVLIGGLFLAPSDVAVLGVAVRVAALVGFFSSASQQFVLRDLVSAMARLGRGEVDALLWRTNVTGLATMLTATVFVLVFGHLVLALFGPDYAEGYWPLLIFLVSQVVRVMGGMNGQLLALAGHQVRSAATCVVAVVLLVVLAAVLTPLWGLIGIALATLGAELFWAISLGVLTQRLEGRRGDIFQGLSTHQFFTAPR